MAFMRPMLAPNESIKERDITFPVFVPPKIDGVRGIIHPHGDSGILLSRSLKPFPNKYVQSLLSHPALVKLDGELTLGAPNAPNVYNRTVSAIMSIEGEPKLTFHVFDYVDKAQYSQRREKYWKVLRELDYLTEWDIVIVSHPLVHNIQEFRSLRDKYIDMGYEGCMLRYPDSAYKHGRATTKEHSLFKYKEFVDAEAEIIEVIEEMENTNAAYTNEIGYTARSSSIAGKVGKKTLGAFLVRDIVDGWEFKIGSFLGLKKEDKKKLWNQRESLVGQLVKYKYQPKGFKDVPRHPTFVGFRHKIDM